jgi:hypothetical protein
MQNHFVKVVAVFLCICACAMNAGGADSAVAAMDLSTAAPRVLYTDLVAGPTSGGEDNLGAYVSVFGINLGTDRAKLRVYFGEHQVAAIRYFGPSVGRPDIQQITVQPGAIGEGPQRIRVEVDGRTSNTDLSFLPNAGDVLYVDNVLGNDFTARANRVDKPWRTLQTPDYGGALAAAKPGDVLVLRGREVWRDIGYDNRWVRFRRTTGSMPSGRRGTGYIALIGYPGESVRYVPPAGTSGGIHGVGDGLAEFSDWIVVSGLRIAANPASHSDGAPINLQVSSDHWRVVNNELGPWPAPDNSHAKAGGVVGNGADVKIFGNEIHGIGGGTENHGIYLDTASRDVEIAYNHIHHVSKGNLIQTFDNLGIANLTRLSIHHNILHDGGRYGVNVADGTDSLRLWSNFIYDTAMAGVRINIDAGPGTDVLVQNNTLYNVCANSRSEQGAVENTWNARGRGKVLVTRNLLVSRGGTCPLGYDNDGEDDAVRLSANQYSGYQPPGKERDFVRDDPHFNDEKNRDLQLRGDRVPGVGAARF